MWLLFSVFEIFASSSKTIENENWNCKDTYSWLTSSYLIEWLFPFLLHRIADLFFSQHYLEKNLTFLFLSSIFPCVFYATMLMQLNDILCGVYSCIIYAQYTWYSRRKLIKVLYSVILLLPYFFAEKYKIIISLIFNLLRNPIRSEMRLKY